MAEDAITVRLRMLNAKRFQAEAHRSAEAIEEIDDATVTIGKRRSVLSRFAGAMTVLSSASGEAGGSVGMTVGRLVGAQVVLSALKVATLGLAFALASPLVASLGAAALGATALGVAAGGALLGAMVLAGGVVARFKDTADIAGTGANRLKTAMGGLKSAFDSAVSPGAAAVMRGLGSAVKSITPTVGALRGEFTILGRNVRQAWVELGESLASPAIRSGLSQLIVSSGQLAGPVTRSIGALAQIFLNIANAAMPYLASGARAVAAQFERWAVATGNTQRLGQIIGGLIGHLKSWLSIVGNVLRIFGAIGVALAPFGEKMAGGLQRATDAAADFLSSAKGIATVRSIFGAIVAVVGVVARVVGVVARAAISGGKQLVEAFRPAMPFFQNILLPLLKGIGQGVLVSIVGAFRVAIAIIKVVATVLGFLGTKLAFLKPVMQAIGQVIGLVFGGPILGAIGLLGKLGGVFSVVAGVARVLLVPLQLVGRVLGVVLGAAGRVASFFAGRFAAAWRLVIAGGRNVLAFFASLPGRFFGVATRVVAFVVRALGQLGGRALGVVRSGLNRVIGFVTGLAGRFFAAGKTIGRAIWTGIKNAITSAAGFIGNIGRSIADFLNRNTPLGDRVKVGPVSFTLPALAQGGTIPVGGVALVGEAGPELAENRGGRTKITPLTARPATPNLATFAGQSPGGDIVVHSHLHLDGREIARSTGRYTADGLARR